jgi:protein SHQ1
MVEFEQIQDVIRSVYRRILIYPIYRNYDLAQTCLSDAKGIFNQGKQAVLRVLLSIKTLFEHSEPRYLLNRLFLDDMIIWLQNLEGLSFREFQRELSEADSISIENLGLKFNIE